VADLEERLGHDVGVRIPRHRRDQRGPTTCRAPGRDIDLIVADHPAPREIHTALGRDTEQHAGRRLAARASGVDIVQTVSEHIDLAAEQSQPALDAILDLSQRCFGDDAERDAALVRDDAEEVSRRSQQRDGFRRAGQPSESVSRAEVVVGGGANVQRPVTIEEDGPPGQINQGRDSVKRTLK
jgi:hypothetical protein